MADDEVVEGASPEEETVVLQKRTGDLIQELDKEMLREDAVEFSPGDTVRVLYNVREGSKARIQAFEGFVLDGEVPGLVKLLRCGRFRVVLA